MMNVYQKYIVSTLESNLFLPIEGASHKKLFLVGFTLRCVMYLFLFEFLFIYTNCGPDHPPHDSLKRKPLVILMNYQY